MKVNWQECKSYPVHGEAIEWSMIGNKRPELNQGPQPPGAACADGFVFFNRATLAPGKRLDLHTGEFEEIYYIVKGSGLFQVAGKELGVVPGDTIYAPAGVEHGLQNTGHSEIDYIVAGSLGGQRP
jgi:hypothetical protein